MNYNPQNKTRLDKGKKIYNLSYYNTQKQLSNITGLKVEHIRSILQYFEVRRRIYPEIRNLFIRIDDFEQFPFLDHCNI